MRMENELKAQKKDSLFSKATFSSIFQKYGITLIFVALVITLSILSPNFLNPMNILNVIRQISIIAIVGFGVTMVIITTGIDLSSGSVIALVSVVAASFAHPGEYPLVIPLFAGLLVGGIAGLINGTLVAKGKIPAFIATLGMMTAARGIALIYSGGRPVTNLSKPFSFIGRGYILGIPFPIYVLLVVAIISHILLKHTKFGKYVYAIGGNEQAARISGINVDKYKILIYSYAGLMSAAAGILLTARLSAGQPTSGVGYELDAIAASVIGGTSLSGGIGTIPGTVIGALIMGTLNNGLDLLHVSAYWQQVIKGLIIVGAVLMDRKRRN